MTIRENNVLYEPLVPRDKIIFPQVHTKLELVKQFVKALDEEGACKAFPGVATEKLKYGIFDGALLLLA